MNGLAVHKASSEIVPLLATLSAIKSFSLKSLLEARLRMLPLFVQCARVMTVGGDRLDACQDVRSPAVGITDTTSESAHSRMK
jgi:hypothetical protein